jgi:succinyl-CoA:(S)-malate CoA-transferase subunit A/succinyl-CoA:(S)-malate CoA-transferase subunit B
MADTPPPAAQALEGIRVLDLGTFIAGPATATLMAEFGADVIKVEQPRVGDPLRSWAASEHGHSPFWAQEARNKRAVTCDLRRPEGQALIKRLVARCDVVVENFRPGALEGWGLGYDDLVQVRPDLVMVRCSGYGQTGPNAPKPGFARIGQAYGGLTYLAGMPGGPPLTPGTTTIADYITPLFAVYGAMLALRHRDRTGQGQVVDAALYEATFRVLDTLAVDYAVTGVPRDRTGRSGTPYAAPHGHFVCKDGNWYALACTTDRMWQRFCRAVGRDDLATDERYATNKARIARREELEALVDEVSQAYTRDELLARMDAEEVAAGPVYSIADIFKDRHYWERAALVKAQDPIFGELVMPGIVPKLSGTPGVVRHLGPPKLGQHNREVYQGLLGLGDAEFTALETAGVL